MEKFSFNKEWYKSSRLRVFIGTGILLVANDMFGLDLKPDTVQMVIGLAASYILGKSGQDALAAFAEVKGKAIVEAAKTGKLDPS